MAFLEDGACYFLILIGVVCVPLALLESLAGLDLGYRLLLLLLSLGIIRF